MRVFRGGDQLSIIKCNNCEPGPLGLVHDPDHQDTTEDDDTLETELNDG